MALRIVSPNNCCVCLHAEVGEINRLLKNKSSAGLVGRLYQLSDDSILRHKPHLADLPVKAETDPRDVLTELRANMDKLTLRMEALDPKDNASNNTFTSLAREYRGHVETLFRINQALRPEAVDWPRIRDAIMEAVRQFPEARMAILEALSQMESR